MYWILTMKKTYLRFLPTNLPFLLKEFVNKQNSFALLFLFQLFPLRLRPLPVDCQIESLPLLRGSNHSFLLFLSSSSRQLFHSRLLLRGRQLEQPLDQLLELLDLHLPDQLLLLGLHLLDPLLLQLQLLPALLLLLFVDRPAQQEKLPQRYANNVTVGYYTGYDHHFCQFLHANNVEAADINDAYSQYSFLSKPTASVVKATKDPDLLSYAEAMRAEDKDKWCEAAKNKILELQNKGTWIEVSISEAQSKIIPGTWVFQIK